MTSCNLTSVDAAVSLNHKPALMVNWIISYKCNLDCSYCYSHDNALSPVPLDTCLKSMKFILEYVDTMLSIKRPHERRVGLNLIGGEPMLHPDIEFILAELHREYNEKYKHRWKLSICVTTNGTVGTNVIERCLDYIDFWTISYHTEALKKQKEICLNSIRAISSRGKKVEVRVMAPAEQVKFDEASAVHSQLLSEGINALLKPISEDFYPEQSANKLKVFWIGQNLETVKDYTIDKGITCCTNRPLTLSSNTKERANFIPTNNFNGWYCGLNFSFLYVNHLGEVYHNTGCFVSYKTNTVEPLGTVDDADRIISELKHHITNKNIPVIVCPRHECKNCGMCAPKANTKEEFLKIMSMHLIDTSVLDFNAH